MSNDFIIKETGDGSPTLHATKFDADYHSIHGAVQESMTVFIDPLTGYIRAHDQQDRFAILELGFGTGLNALLSKQLSDRLSRDISYTSLEKYIVPEEVYASLRFDELIKTNDDREDFIWLHQSEWNKSVVRSNFSLHKVHADFEDFQYPSNHFDAIFHDAFAPSCQAIFWEAPFLAHIYKALKTGGQLTTFCAKGSFKRALKSCGFTVKALPGPIGKREMTLAIKE